MNCVNGVLRLPVMRRSLALAGFAALALALPLTPAQAADPIKIGFSAQLTGGLASSGKAILLAQEIWKEEINAKDGLLGRPIQFVYYDDQSNTGLVPGIYSKLIDVDKVDLLMGAATNIIVAAMPIIMERKKLVVTNLALAINDNFKYPRYFQNSPWGPDGKQQPSADYFQVARMLDPKPKTLALVGADAEFANNAIIGARANAKKEGYTIVYDKSYPPSTVDFTPIVRAIAATNPDIVFVASYPIDSVGMIQAVKEIGLKAALFGGAMVGTQYAGIKTQLGEKLNRVVGYEMWSPGPKMDFPGVADFLKKYQAKAKEQGADPLGFYQPPLSYASMQILEQAITATGSIKDDVLSEHMHKATFKTVMGDVKFDALGEWEKPRLLMVQFQGIKGNDLQQFAKEGVQTVVYPPEYKNGDLQFPFAK